MRWQNDIIIVEEKNGERVKENQKLISNSSRLRGCCQQVANTLQCCSLASIEPGTKWEILPLDSSCENTAGGKNACSCHLKEQITTVIYGNQEISWVLLLLF